MNSGKMRLILFTILLIPLSSPLFAAKNMSEYTLQKYKDYTKCRAIWTTYPDANVILSELQVFLNEVLPNLPEKAIDAEQESLFWKSSVLVSTFEFSFNEKSDFKKERLALKDQIKLNEEYISAHKKTDGVSPLLYMITGDATSFYMSFSVASAMFHGMRVKKLYELASQNDSRGWSARLGLGQWLFYAPAVFGGGMEKSKSTFLAAVNAAQTNAEKFFTYLYYSQILFEDGQKELCNSYIEKAEALFPNSNLSKRIRRFNAQGISLYAFNREHSGAEKNTDPNAKDL